MSAEQWWNQDFSGTNSTGYFMTFSVSSNWGEIVFALHCILKSKYITRNLHKIQPSISFQAKRLRGEWEEVPSKNIPHEVRVNGKSYCVIQSHEKSCYKLGLL